MRSDEANEPADLSADEKVSPRKKLTQSAIGMRSRSSGPAKFAMRRNGRGSQQYGSQERSASGSGTGNRGKILKGNNLRKKNGEGGIIEQVEEEDKTSCDYDSGDEALIKQTIKIKKNLLCKTLLDQTKELCYQHSPVYKDFDQIFTRIMHRF